MSEEENEKKKMQRAPPNIFDVHRVVVAETAFFGLPENINILKYYRLLFTEIPFRRSTLSTEPIDYNAVNGNRDDDNARLK